MADSLSRSVSLSAGDLGVDLAPGTGGAIVGFRRGADLILRDTPPGAARNGRASLAGAFAMIPYANRIADARFGFGAQTFDLARNFGDSPHSIHGNGWQRAWAVAASTRSSALLTLSHRPDNAELAGQWPFAYEAEQRFTLTADTLSITLVLTNRDTRAMPAGIGFHPYFDRAGATLRFAARTFWASDTRLMPTERRRLPAEWDASAGLAVDDIPAVDHCFEAWGGLAEIAYEARDLRISMAADPVFSKLQVFRADDKSFFAVEPVSHMVDAVNRRDIVTDHGLAILSPGETLRGTITLGIGRLH